MEIKNFFTKKTFIILALIIILILVIFLLKTLLKKETILIDVVGKAGIEYTLSYDYGTEVRIKQNDYFDILVIAENTKKVKCQSSDKNIIEIEKFIVKAKNIGAANIFCKRGINKSNIIQIKVEESL